MVILTIENFTMAYCETGNCFIPSTNAKHCVGMSDLKRFEYATNMGNDVYFEP